MITHIWLKKQPKKKLSYPNCYPLVYKNTIVTSKTIHEFVIEAYNSQTNIVDGKYLVSQISRVEFRP